MALLTNSWAKDFSIYVGLALIGAYLTYGTWIFTLAAYTFLGVYAFYQYKFLHWWWHDIPVSSPRFPFGDVTSILFKAPGDVMRDLYDRGKGHAFMGVWFLFRPALLIRDPELIKHILVKDFATFHERGIYTNSRHDPLSGHIFALGGQKWRNLRAKLTPTFTSGKLKAMFPQFLKTAETLEHKLTDLAQKEEVIDAKEISVQFTTDLTTLTSFGITTNALTDPNDHFRSIGRTILKPSFLTIARSLLPFLVPDLSEFIGVIQIPVNISKIFMKAIKDIVLYRETSGMKRDDFMGILCELRNLGKVSAVDGIRLNVANQNEEFKFTMRDVAAESLLFFVSGFETPAVTMSFALYELAINQALQEQARHEIRQVLGRHEGKLTYEAIHQMTFLDRVIFESLRMYPPVPLLLRKSNAPYTIPDSDFVIPTGTQVHISVHGLHRDPQFYPDPDKFDPERFTDLGKATRHHYSYLPFGEGPRNCFGMRYTMMQKKVGLVTMLNKFEFSLCDESPYPLEFDPDSFIFAAKGGMKLRISKAL